MLYALILGGRRVTDRLDAYRGRIQTAMGVVMVAVAVVMIANLDVKFENAIARHLPSALVDPDQPDRAELRASPRGSPTCAGAARFRTRAAPRRRPRGSGCRF